MTTHSSQPCLSDMMRMDAAFPPAPHRQPRPRVLIVEDDSSARRALRRLLEEDGYEVITAADGAEGLDLAIACPPDVVLSDVHMPRMDGLALVQQLRSQYPWLPVVLMSSDLDVAARATEAVAFLAKPLDLDVLERALAQACNVAA
jgi:CheY-like chemotaxis protein